MWHGADIDWCEEQTGWKNAVALIIFVGVSICRGACSLMARICEQQMCLWLKWGLSLIRGENIVVVWLLWREMPSWPTSALVTQLKEQMVTLNESLSKREATLGGDTPDEWSKHLHRHHETCTLLYYKFSVPISFQICSRYMFLEKKPEHWKKSGLKWLCHFVNTLETTSNQKILSQRWF